MKFVSIQPLLDALDRAKQTTILVTSARIPIDEMLLSSDLRRGLVASIFVVSDRALEAATTATRQEVESTLLEHVVRELNALEPEQLPDGMPHGFHNVNWLSREELDRDYGGSYDRYMRA